MRDDFGAEDVARQSDLLALKAQSATGIELKNLQDKVDSIEKMLKALSACMY